MTSFNLNYFHRSPVSKQSDSEGRGLQHMNFEGDTIQSLVAQMVKNLPAM